MGSQTVTVAILVDVRVIEIHGYSWYVYMKLRQNYMRWNPGLFFIPNETLYRKTS